MVPLAGVTVLELGTMITAPLAGMMLADLGAEVIKIERPDGGDPFRNFSDGTVSPHFVAFNRNKRSVVLDLQTSKGRADLLHLIDTADVLLENFRPAVLVKLGLEAATLRARNPRLVHCSITGFGETGPYAQRPGYDTVGQALSGILALAIDPRHPVFAGTTISDNITGMYASFGILAALLERQHTGQGRRIQVNMLEASAAFIPDTFMRYSIDRRIVGPFDRIASSQSYIIQCRDKKFLALHLSSQTKFWENLLQVLNNPEFAEDPRFKTRTDRVQRYPELVEALNGEFSRRDRPEWLERLKTVDIAFAPVNNVEEAMADPQLGYLETFRDLPLPDGSTARSVQTPILFDGQRPTAWSGPPALGQHTLSYMPD